MCEDNEWDEKKRNKRVKKQGKQSEKSNVVSSYYS